MLTNESNYGKGDGGRGNKGCRLNLDVWCTVFVWMGGLGWTRACLACRVSPGCVMDLHMYRPAALSGKPSSEVGEFACVRVGKPGSMSVPSHHVLMIGITRPVTGFCTMIAWGPMARVGPDCRQVLLLLSGAPGSGGGCDGMQTDAVRFR
jgi:hypothetical protein